MGLRNSFKNFRKTIPKESKQSAKRSSTGFGEPYSKYLKVCDDQPDIDEEEYEAAKKDLKAEYKKILKKKGGSYAEVRRLMKKTKIRQRKWIASEEPIVSEVLLKFPCLASKRHVSSKCKVIVYCNCSCAGTTRI